MDAEDQRAHFQNREPSTIYWRTSERRDQESRGKNEVIQPGEGCSSGWTEGRAVWNKGAAGGVAATQDVEEDLPFGLLGFDCDNGSEFLNHHWGYMTKRRRPVEFTRSRPYHKDDNAHVEQKNWMWPRQLLGYSRLEDVAVVVRICQVYKEVWGGRCTISFCRA